MYRQCQCQVAKKNAPGNLVKARLHRAKKIYTDGIGVTNIFCIVEAIYFQSTLPYFSVILRFNIYQQATEVVHQSVGVEQL